MSLKKEVLSLYFRILRVARSWKASSGRAEDTLVERTYIANECRELFRQNSKLTDDQDISRCLEEARTRLELGMYDFENCWPGFTTIRFLSIVESDWVIPKVTEAPEDYLFALHYGNPYPRPVNLPPMALASQGKLKAQQRSRKQAKPVYLHSHKELD